MTIQGFRITNKGRAALIAMRENNKQDEEVPAHYRIADALAEAGLLAPDLPEPNDPGIFVPDGKGWIPGGSHGPSVWTAPGSPIMVQRIEPGDLTSDEARKLAYALLAAADYAEEQE
ncbi:Uncharacterised protein [Corynebacterium striatum]|uniref:Uncharacterized protein n=1 Tax=Corynebacterium striatum TaxID=43770 RepID=A0AAQ1Z899_CORST|nr:hypothetical protein [Corynebacterium striatum]EEI77686.1 hypothetical protein HMPREF0308_2062 [Corynebacterium striatum ATCC 6940]QQE54459.1 hypothetical protein I6I11_07740 [Corynebacterium striatum]GEA42089.1 hypothetical protein Cst04h_02590 [Corynebacterium striatum]STD63110.1 Uncharacterised protein [Corynebacterium striatum]